MKLFLAFSVVMMSFTGTKSLFAAPSKETLFCTPALISAKLSPDGDLIAQVGADEKGVPNVFIRDKNSSAFEQLSFFKTPAIIQFFWSPESNKVLVLKDENGTGQLHLHGFDVSSKEHISYTEKFPRVNTKVTQLSSKENKIVVGLNHRNPHFHDLYVLDLDSGDFTLLLENNAYAKFLVSEDLKPILKIKINENGSWTVFTDKEEVFLDLSSEDAFQTEFLSFESQEDAVYMLDNRFSNTNQLTRKRLSGQEEVLGGQSDSDVEEVLFLEGKPKAYASYYSQKRWHVLDPSIQEDITFLEQQVGSNFEVVSQSKKGAVWIVSNSIPDRGTLFWLYERSPRNLLQLSSSSEESFSKMYEMIVEARDGEKLVCYYTLPKEYDRGGRVDSPIPLVVFPHGGPFKLRDRFEFNPYHQWLASCGYAALSINFRLSSGFGKAFVNAGNGEWGGKAHLDVLDAVEACIAKGIAQRGKVAIVGGSYGGYESLAALTFTPEYFTCCVSICGPSNLKTVLENVPQFWEFTQKPLSDKMAFFTKQAFITSMGGDPEIPSGAGYLEKCSPLNHLDKIQAPLLLIHGKNDHVVTEKESNQIYESMKQNGMDVTYILFPDEGHRFANFSNKMMFLDRTEQFLSQHLHGKYKPCDPEVIAGSSAEVFN